MSLVFFMPLIKTLIIPLATPLIIGSVKTIAPKLTEKIPGFLMPLVAAVIGILAGNLTGINPDVANAAVAGIAGTGIHQIKSQLVKSGE